MGYAPEGVCLIVVVRVNSCLCASLVDCSWTVAAKGVTACNNARQCADDSERAYAMPGLP